MSGAKTYYIAGGEYGDTPQTRKFGIVQPTDGNPYVAIRGTSAETLRRFTRHHSHFYELSEDLTTANPCEASTGADDFPAPKTETLTARQREEVISVIAAGEVYMAD